MTASFVEALRRALGDVRLATGVEVIWKDADPTWWSRLPADLTQHRNAHCLAVKADGRRRARCIGIDGVEAGDFPKDAPRLRTCAFGVTELLVPIYVAGSYHGCCFIGPWRGQRVLPALVATHRSLDAPPTRERIAAIGRLVSAAMGPVLFARTATRTAERAKHDGLMEQARAWIESHLSANLRVRHVAAAVGLSPSRFVHRFSEVCGIAFSPYVRRRLMEEAARRLMGSPEAIGDIALDLGFANHTRFTAAFHQVVGCSPSQFRRRLEA